MTRVVEAMSHGAVSVPSDTPVENADRIATQQQVHYVLIVEGQDCLVGVLCTCELLDAEPGRSVSHYMSVPVVTVGPAASLKEAAARMRDKDVGCLPVVVGHRVLGAVTRRDLQRAGFLVVARQRCSACGSTKRVRPDRNMEGIAFCRLCLTQGRRPECDEDLGTGD